MRRVLTGLFVLVVVSILLWRPAKSLLLQRYGVSELTVGTSLVLQWLGWKSEGTAYAPDLAGVEPAQEIELNQSFVPFRNIGESLGSRARGNNMTLARGATIFDANGDGRLDLYLPHTGRPVAKATDADGILQEASVPAKASALYLNQGENAQGDPIFRSVQELIAEGNGSWVREELLIENKYRPRSSLEEDEFGPGRIAHAAIAADFDADGRMDLYICNFHYGLMAQTHQFGMRVYPAQNNLGRQARAEPVVVRFPSFLWGPQEDGLEVTVGLGLEPEPEGRNLLYRNLGDRDGDGIPEWEDVTDQAGVGGRWASASADVADFDRDGDLDLYVANFLDPDFWGFGDRAFSGNRNQLYVNMLVETGELRFEDRAKALGVAGLHDGEGLTSTVYFPSEGRAVEVSDQVVEGRIVGERADHSWACLFSDWNRDGWMDLVVANDVGNRLRVYENLRGRRFSHLESFNGLEWDGCWMGMSVGDLDGDGGDEIFVTNCGSQVMSVRNNAFLIKDESEANLLALAVLNYPHGRSTMHHAVLSHEAGRGLLELAREIEVHHSPYIPPDMVNPANFAPDHRKLYEENNFATSLTAYEFALNAPLFDVDNDGDLDIYMAGSLARGNDAFVGDWSGSPGRLLVNESRPGRMVFRDRTLEYQLLDIQEMEYEANPPRRRAPGTNWHKRDFIYVADTGGYTGAGIDASSSEIRDLFRMHEAAFGVYAADLNGDGSEDLVVTHAGGYDSNLPSARNMKVAYGGRVLSVPAPNKVMQPPTAFEEGPTFVYINGGPPRGAAGHWIKIRLYDRSSKNLFGIGSRVVINDTIARSVLIAAGAGFGGVTSDLHVGLGSDGLRSVEIVWGSGGQTPQHLELELPLRDRLVCIDREAGIVDCRNERESAI